MQLSGVEPKTGMLDFLDYVGNAPLVAFRAEFDRTMLTRALKSILGVPFNHPWIDLAFLLPALFRGTECNTLEDWLSHFEIAPAARHQALADAFATAQLLQIVLHAADRQRLPIVGYAAAVPSTGWKTALIRAQPHLVACIALWTAASVDRQDHKQPNILLERRHEPQ